MKSSRLGILSSVFASVCCVGPLVAVMLGVGGVGLAAFFGKYHWVWLAIAAAMLSAGWMRYRKESKTACETGCDLSTPRKTRGVLLGASVVLAVFLALNVWTHLVRAGSDTTQAQPAGGRILDIPVGFGTWPSMAGEVAVIGVDGMVCFTCEVALKTQLQKLAGILSVDANSKDGRVTVRFDPATVDRPRIEEAINATGYQVSHREATP
ncbi:cation transporter [bacterium]|nr:cation transporter [bacterium]